MEEEQSSGPGCDIMLISLLHPRERYVQSMDRHRQRDVCRSAKFMDSCPCH